MTEMNIFDWIVLILIFIITGIAFFHIAEKIHT